jgi:hypothetical protein
LSLRNHGEVEAICAGHKGKRAKAQQHG